MTSDTHTTGVGVQVIEFDAPENVLTRDHLRHLESLLARIRYLGSACALLGLPRRLYLQWKREGATLLNTKRPSDLTPREKALVAFSKAVDAGIAQGEMADLEVLTAAGERNWRAAAWRLERRAPQRWARKPKPKIVKVDDDDDDDDNYWPRAPIAPRPPVAPPPAPVHTVERPNNSTVRIPPHPDAVATTAANPPTSRPQFDLGKVPLNIGPGDPLLTKIPQPYSLFEICAKGKKPERR